MRNIMGGNVIYIKCIERILGHFIYFMTDYKLGNNYSFETIVDSGHFLSVHIQIQTQNITLTLTLLHHLGRSSSPGRVEGKDAMEDPPTI